MSEKACPYCDSSIVCALANLVKNQQDSLGDGLPVPGTKETRPVPLQSIHAFIMRVEKQKRDCQNPSEVDDALTSFRQAVSTMYSDSGFPE